MGYYGAFEQHKSGALPDEVNVLCDEALDFRSRLDEQGLRL